MYRLLSGLYAHLTRKTELNIIIIGLDNAGKTTFLEMVKTLFNPSNPGLDPSLIHPTIGQNIGRITLSSSHLLFWDLGGQRDLRTIWDKYFREADAVCWVIDSRDRTRCGWQGMPGCSSDISRNYKGKERAIEVDDRAPANGGGTQSGVWEGVWEGRGEGWRELENVLRHPLIRNSGIPVLVLANKQDVPSPHELRSEAPQGSTNPPTEPEPPMRVEDIKEMFNRLVMESDRSEKARSLGVSEAQVMGISALTGEGVREAVQWLFYRLATKAKSRRALAEQQQQRSSAGY